MVESKGVNRCIVGGRLLDSHVNYVLRRTGIPPIRPHFRINKFIGADGVNFITKDKQLNNIHRSYSAWMNLEAGRDLKESVCRMADFTLQDGDPRFTNLPLIPYELPDGTQVDVGIERFLLPELFIDPSPVNRANPDLVNLFATSTEDTSADILSSETTHVSTSLPALIRDSVIRSDMEMQTMLLANMVLTGGSSSFEGMSERIRTEVEKLVHSAAPGWRVKLTSAGAGERSLSPWLGGSILGSLGSFHEVWVSRAEYDEYGPSIVDRKCP
jgi:actin-like protein 6A